MSYTDLMRIMQDHPARAEVHRLARVDKPSEGNRCAITASHFLRMAKLIKRKYLGTIGLQRHLESLGWQRIPSIDALQPGDVCFSKDGNRNGCPDHVYIFVEYDGHNSALIADNYQVGLHSRNLGPGPRTPFAFAMRPPR